MREWTEAQKAAITERGRTLLVSAAAGSGKTAVLNYVKNLRKQQPGKQKWKCWKKFITLTKAFLVTKIISGKKMIVYCGCLVAKYFCRIYKVSR